jgi:hypothetical protein
MTRNQEIEKAIAELAEHGRVAVVESRRDCDGVQVSGYVRIIRARLKDFLELENKIARCAEGPFCLQLERPSIARRIEPALRDLTMEAFENGRQHHLIGGSL